MRSFEELQMYTNRRRRERVDASLGVRFGLAALDREAVAGNVSEGGLYIRTNQVFHVGTRLQLAIEFPRRVVRCAGEVMWAITVPEHQCRTLVHGMGIQFVDTEPEWKVFFERWRDGLPR